MEGDVGEVGSRGAWKWSEIAADELERGNWLRKGKKILGHLSVWL